jgi:hypothetical protein
MDYSTHKEVNELKGNLSLTFEDNKNLEEFCQANFANYDSNRYQAVALRFFYGKEMIITLYALDKDRKDRGESGKLPVKKFKTNTLPLSAVMPFIKEFNFTLTTDRYGENDIEVINK